MLHFWASLCLHLSGRGELDHPAGPEPDILASDPGALGVAEAGLLLDGAALCLHPSGRGVLNNSVESESEFSLNFLSK